MSSGEHYRFIFAINVPDSERDLGIRVLLGSLGWGNYTFPYVLF